MEEKKKSANFLSIYVILNYPDLQELLSHQLHYNTVEKQWRPWLK